MAADVPPLSLAALQQLLWQHVGSRRHGQGLTQACTILRQWEAQLSTPQDRPSHERANLLLCGRLLTEAAILRTESRSAHYREGFPQLSDAWRHHLVYRREHYEGALRG